jgi:hypothetical protein
MVPASPSDLFLSDEFQFPGVSAGKTLHELGLLIDE